MYRCFTGWRIGDSLFKFLVEFRDRFEDREACCESHQVVKDTFVQLPLSWSALPELLVVVIQAGPVLAEFCKAVFVYVFYTVQHRNVSSELCNTQSFLPRKHHLATSASSIAPHPQHPPHGRRFLDFDRARENLHALCTSCNPSALLQAVHLCPTWLLSLALHKVIVIWPASCTNKKTGG